MAFVEDKVDAAQKSSEFTPNLNLSDMYEVAKPHKSQIIKCLTDCDHWLIKPLLVSKAPKINEEMLSYSGKISVT